jgi:HAD superfamily hydrolase (TIGR01484 family)
MAKPVICFDIDGTLVNDRGEIHPQDIEILSQPEPPALFIPGTGRLLASVCRLFTRHSMFLDRKIPFPLVLQNGAVVYAPDEVLLFSHLFSESLSQELIELVFQTPEVAFFIFLENHVFVHGLTDFSRNLQQRFDLEVEALQAGQNIRMNKVMAVSENQEYLKKIANSTNRDGIEQSFSLPMVLELTPAGIDKGKSLLSLLEKLGFDDSTLLAAGDGGNDLSLFALTPHTFAPAAAPLDIRSQAAQIIDVGKNGLLEPMLSYAFQFL